MIKKLLLLFALSVGASSLFFACSTISNRDLAKASVMIRTFAKNSGGTGVILHSYQYHSVVLTNAHVCDVIKDGGVITTGDNKDHFISRFIKAKGHDLCLIQVQENLNVNSKLAMNIPSNYDKVTIIGHPKLNPTTISHGYFGNKMIVNILIGTKLCQPEDFANPETAFACALFNTMPIIKTYESIYVSATIEPGSSGSPVYNEKGEIAGLVFAGSGDFGYGLAVPLEYIHNFLYNELQEYQQKE